MPDIIFAPSAIPVEPDDTDTTVEEESVEITITVGADSIQPVHVKTYNADSYGTHSELADACGNTETRQGNATGFQLTMEGILTLDQLREAKRIGLSNGTEVVIDLQPWSEQYIVDTFSFDKPNDLNEWYSPNYPEGVEAFTFQLQTKDPTTNNNN